MTVTVVDLFKMVQVHIADGKGQPLAGKQRPLTLQDLKQVATIEQAGQIIPYGHLTDLLHRPGQLMVLVGQGVTQTVDAPAGNGKAHRDHGKHQPLQGFHGQTQLHPAVVHGQPQHHRIGRTGKHRHADHYLAGKPERDQQQAGKKQGDHTEPELVHVVTGDHEYHHEVQYQRQGQTRFTQTQGPAGGKQQLVGHQGGPDHEQHHQPLFQRHVKIAELEIHHA